MVGVGELLASAALKQVAGMLGTAIWGAIASQLKLGDELKALKDTLDSIHESVVKSEKMLMKDGDVRVWMRKLKAVAYDMEDMIMEVEGDILKIRHGSQSNNSTMEISIPMKLRLTMPGKLKDMKRRLENIEKLRRFDLTVDTSSDDQDVIQMWATFPCLEEGIVGRHKEKAELMKLLREDRKHNIIPIYGFGGLGKTTLAQMVFQDSRTKTDFDIVIWVYVSRKFSTEKIGRSIISYLDGQSNQYDLPSVQKRVAMILDGKKYLIVLDDLWEQNTSNLDKLKAMLKGGAPGSKIIVTTRSEQVAKRMNRELPFKLDALPYDDCLKLFKCKAFPIKSKESDEFIKVGEKIVKKCGGIPLAVKSLGDRLLDMPLHKWEETLNCELWESEHDPTTATASTAVLPSLKISYYYMPYYLRPCFVYFSLFPKGFVIEKRDLVHRWIALGYVSTTRRAEDYLQELCQMSFLEATSASTSISAGYSKPNNPHDLLFKMHDLVHELARSVAVEEVAFCDANRGSSGAKKDICRYMLFSNFKDGYLKCKDMPLKARAIHFNDCTGCEPSRYAFSESKWLRVLDLPSMQTVELPSSMRNLHHLQVLNLSENTSLVKLHSSFGKAKLHSPTSICDFEKLRYLDIHGCSNLRELPDNIHILQDLEHLDLSGCTSLQKLPSRFGELQMLSFLNLSYSQLEILPGTFSQLENLEYLNLSFCSKLKHFHTLSIKRMKRLVYLNMSSCTWLEALPEFYGDNDGCQKLEILDLSDCDRLINLSESFARLNNVRFLSLSGCSRIQNIIRFLGNFVLLEYLNLSGVPLSGFDVRNDFEAPSSSTGHSSGHSGEDLSLRMLNEIIKRMPHLEYLSAGGLSLFSKEGIADSLTLPDFVVSTRSSGNSSNISLLQNILNPTHRELNIRCLEAVISVEEAAMIELSRKHRLASLSLEWSSTEWYTPNEPTVKTMAVLEHLQPHQNLKHLTIKGYNHSEVPRWITEIRDALPNLVKLVLSDLVWCDHLPDPANLLNIEELVIQNMPLLKKACLSPTKNLKQLSLVALSSGFTLKFIQETSKDCQGIHDIELDHAEQSEAPEVARTQFVDPSQENREAEQAIVKGDMRKNEGVRFLPTIDFKRKAKMLDLPVSSPTPSATKATVPNLCSLKIEYCQGLKLYPSINCDEYFINESKVDFITDTGSSAPILARKMHFKNCSHHTAILLQGVHIRTDELVIDGCIKQFLNHMAIKFDRGYDGFDLCDKESLNFGIQKLKITNSEDFDLEYVPCIPSLQELQIDCIKVIGIDSFGSLWGKLKNLKKMDKLEKITLSPQASCLYKDIWKGLLLAIPHLQCVKINEVVYQNRDIGFTELCLSDLHLMKEAKEVDPGELDRYDQLCRLSLRWSGGQPNKANTSDDSAVLQRLQPHANLSMLEIRGYQGATFCAWMRNANLSVPNLVKIELVGMPRCERLPSLGQLANLEELHISDLPNIREVDTSFYGGKNPFRKLRKLHVHGMGNLEVWSTNLEPSAGENSWNDGEQQLQRDEIFPSLKHLIIKGCPRLMLDSSGIRGPIKHIIESCSKLAVSFEEITAYSQDSAVLQVQSRIQGISEELLQYLIVEGSTLGAQMSIANLYLPNLVKIELVDIPTCEHLPSLGQLANLEELHISDMPNIQKVDAGFYGGKHPFRKLRELHIDWMENLEMWSTNLEPSAGRMPPNGDEQKLQGDKIFPCLKDLKVKECPRLKLDSGFHQGCIKRIIGSCSKIEISARIFIGSSEFSRLEAETNIFGFSSGLELLRYSSIKLNNLTIKSNSDLITLPGTIKNCQTIRSFQILDCWNFSVLPDWLGDLTCLEKLEVHAPKLQCLPHAIKGLTSLKTLTLKKCNYKLLERYSISGEDYEKIEHIKYHVQEGLEISIDSDSSSDLNLLEKTTSHQLIELNIKDLQHLSSSEAEKINLVGKEDLQLLSLQWNSKCGVVNNIALEQLQPHQNLRRLFIKNYPINAGFPHWMQSLPNLVSMELSNVQAGHLHLDHLQNLEDLHVSSFSTSVELLASPFNTLNGHIRSQGFDYARSLLRISSTQVHKKLRRVTMTKVGRLVWESSCLPADNLFPGLEYLEIDSCLDVKFEPSIPRSAMYVNNNIRK